MHPKRESGAGGPLHAVRFYKDHDSLCELVAAFLGDGLDRGEPAVVIATAPHVAGIARHLGARGREVDRLVRTGSLLIADAGTVLAGCLLDGMPHVERFACTVTPLLEQAAGPERRTVRAYGEMVDVLWKAGRTTAATRLEMLWNDLAMQRPFSLLCGYAVGNFYKGTAVDQICSHHSHVYGDGGLAALT